MEPSETANDDALVPDAESSTDTTEKPKSRATSGETDLAKMLKSITVTVRPDDYVVISLPTPVVAPVLGDGVAAVIEEDEGTTVIATITRAAYEGWPHDFVAAWLTIDVHSSLEAVGLTAAFSRQLGRAGIACNVVAGFHHDHILVPHDKSHAAVEVIEALRPQNPENEAGKDED